jgi:outer membrane immunogenic protein
VSRWRLLGAASSLIQVLFVAGAVAADLPVKAAPPLPALSWTGFYLGANVGGGFSQKTFIDNFLALGPPIGGIDASPRPSGWVGGLQAGYNYQINSILFGLEGDFTWLGTKSSFSCFPLLAPQTCTADPEWVAALTGRLGVVTGPALFYVKGGPAWIRDTYTDLALPGAPRVALPGVFFVGTDIRPGWTAGVGVEYMFLPSWSLRLEYDYFGFDDRSIGFDGVGGGYFTELIRQNLQTVTLGVDYHFGAAAAPAPLPILTKEARSNSDETASNIMAFTGIDVSKFSASGWIGTLIAPSKDLDTSGWRVWLVGESGGYLYYDKGAAFHGIYESGEVLAGYGFEGDHYSINLLAGPNAINHMVSPYDPTNHVQGTDGGIKFRADAYLTPATGFMSYSEGEYSTAFQTYWAREKIGFDITNGQQIYVGPEITALGDERFSQWRVGAHISNMKIGKMEIDLSAGFAGDSIVGTSAYGHVELSENF